MTRGDLSGRNVGPERRGCEHGLIRVADMIESRRSPRVLVAAIAVAALSALTCTSASASAVTVACSILPEDAPPACRR